jgi:hypothetical protein
MEGEQIDLTNLFNQLGPLTAQGLAEMIAMETDPMDIGRLCQTDSRFRRVCQSRRFWQAKFFKTYGFDLDEIYQPLGGIDIRLYQRIIQSGGIRSAQVDIGGCVTVVTTASANMKYPGGNQCRLADQLLKDNGYVREIINIGTMTALYQPAGYITKTELLNIVKNMVVAGGVVTDIQ